jgi:hypothetical protein
MLQSITRAMRLRWSMVRRSTCTWPSSGCTFDFEGTPLWQTPLEPHKVYLDFGSGSSPALHGDALVILNDNDLGTRQIAPLLDPRHDERDGRISPDGHWLAYASDESGRFEIYLQRFPELGDKLQLSTDGGLMPFWESDGKTRPRQKLRTASSSEL